MLPNDVAQSLCEEGLRFKESFNNKNIFERVFHLKLLFIVTLDFFMQT